MQRPWPMLALAVAVLALDRVTKLWIQARLGLYDTINVVPGMFDIVHSENRGMAFGIGNDGATWMTRAVLIIVSLAVLGALAFMFRGAKQMTNPGEAIALSLVASGAAGNLYDRVVHGQVTDFLDVYLGQFHWPSFNVADSAIVVGAVLIAWNAVRGVGRPRTTAAI